MTLDLVECAMNTRTNLHFGTIVLGSIFEANSCIVQENRALNGNFEIRRCIFYINFFEGSKKDLRNLFSTKKSTEGHAYKKIYV